MKRPQTQQFGGFVVSIVDDMDAAEDEAARRREAGEPEADFDESDCVTMPQAISLAVKLGVTTDEVLSSPDLCDRAAKEPHNPQPLRDDFVEEDVLPDLQEKFEARFGAPTVKALIENLRAFRDAANFGLELLSGKETGMLLLHLEDMAGAAMQVLVDLHVTMPEAGIFEHTEHLAVVSPRRR